MDATDRLIAEALSKVGRELRTDRTPDQGLLELKELAPSLADAMKSEGAVVNGQSPIAQSRWNRESTEVDIVIPGDDVSVRAVVELKVWDVGQQLFDLVKVCCLLAAGAEAGYLVCVAKRDADFDRTPIGVLFPANAGESVEHDLRKLIQANDRQWRHDVVAGHPGPTQVPESVVTTAITAPVPIVAYGNHTARAVRVEVPPSTSWSRPEHSAT